MSWSCAVQTRDKKQHRTAPCRKCKEELGHPLATKATYYKQINVNEQWEQGSVFFFGRRGTLWNCDSDGNEKVKNAISKTTNSANAPRSLVNFFAFPAKLRRENKWPNFKFSWEGDTFYCIVLSLGSGTLSSAEWTSCNNREKVWKDARFPWLFTGVAVIKS